MLTQCDTTCLEACNFFEGQRTHSVRPWCYPTRMQWATGAHTATATDENHSIIFRYFGAVEAKRTEQDLVTR